MIIKLLTITWNYEDSYDIENTFLYKSFIKNNNIKNLVHIHYNRNNHIEIENKFKDRFDFQSEYILYKLFLTKDKINQIDSDYLIFCDANDTVCLGNLNDIVLQENIIFSSEINQYPSSMGNWGIADYLEEDRKNRCFLNSGLWIASKNNYINLLNSVIENILPLNLKTFGGDQGIFVYHYLSKGIPEIKLDKESKLFLSTYLKDHNQYAHGKLPMFVHDNGWHFGSPKFIEKFKLIE